MYLNQHVVAVFAANGAIAQAAAAAFDQAGATVCLAARNPARLASFTSTLAKPGVIADVDVLDETAVAHFLNQVYDRYGRLDAVFNGIGPQPAAAHYGTLATSLALEHFTAVHQLVVGGQFITGRAAARLWARTESCGTVLTLTSSLSRLKMMGMSSLASASAAVEGLTRALAAELAPLGCRAIGVNATALPETQTIVETTRLQAARLGITPEEMQAGMQQGYLLGRGPSLVELGQLLAFLASESGAILNSHILDADRGTASVL